MAPWRPGVASRPPIAIAFYRYLQKKHTQHLAIINNVAQENVYKNAAHCNRVHRTITSTIFAILQQAFFKDWTTQKIESVLSLPSWFFRTTQKICIGKMLTLSSLAPLSDSGTRTLSIKPYLSSNWKGAFCKLPPISIRSWLHRGPLSVFHLEQASKIQKLLGIWNSQ